MNNTFTYNELLEAVEYATDHAVQAYADDYMDYDGYDMDHMWHALKAHIIEHAHTPAQLCPSTSPNGGETNKYMVTSNMIAALVHTPDGPVLKSVMTPNHRQRKWMENN